MTQPAVSSPRRPARRRRRGYVPGRIAIGSPHSQRSRVSEERLARYADGHGRRRELLVRPGVEGSVLVIDRDADARADTRLVAHLAADEPAENVALIVHRYLADRRCGRLRCRALTPQDELTPPLIEVSNEPTVRIGRAPELQDDRGLHYRLEHVMSGRSIPELRWCRRGPDPARHDRVVVSMREVVARLQAYEPARSLTRSALAHHEADARVSTTVLRAELNRVLNSPIVLNRGLREAVVAIVARGEASMSEIAMRCGRRKLDARGNVSGETSWLARRLGLAPEGGQHEPTPWVHSDVLALIARDGLAMSPREVELE